MRRGNENSLEKFSVVPKVLDYKFPKEGFRSPKEKRIMSEKLQRMPDTSIFPSLHVIINKERTKNYLPLLKRCGVLDAFARHHASSMSKERTLIKKMDENYLIKLQQKIDLKGSFGLNVDRGLTIRAIQENFMRSNTSKSNILSKDYDMMGVGTAFDSKGKLYICQIFARSRFYLGNRTNTLQKSDLLHNSDMKCTHV